MVDRLIGANKPYGGQPFALLHEAHGDLRCKVVWRDEKTYRRPSHFANKSFQPSKFISINFGFISRNMFRISVHEGKNWLLDFSCVVIFLLCIAHAIVIR